MPKQLTMVKPWLLPNKGAGGAFLPHAHPLTAKEVDLPSLLPWRQESLCKCFRPRVRIWRRGTHTSSLGGAQHSSPQPYGLVGMGWCPH